MNLKICTQAVNLSYIYINHHEILFSYDTPIAMYYNNQMYLDERNWDYSKTTGKHRNEFLNENIDDTRKKIKTGEYKLVDLVDFIAYHFNINLSR